MPTARPPAPLTIARAGADLRARLDTWRAAGDRVALVPTMGALHEGHRSLVLLARQTADRVVASLFVNPAQFGPDEDFRAYPRDEAADAAKLAEWGCDLLFAPAPEEIYPPGFSTQVTVGAIACDLEGAIRPGHFAGVATVVTKLLLLAWPETAVFGEKDFQQLLVVRRLVSDLGLPVRVLAAPTARAPDGVALSSRNAYLTANQRRVAPALRRVLGEAAAFIRSGGEVARAEAEGQRQLLMAGFDRVDYLAARDCETLGPAGEAAVDRLRLLAAARLGRTRLLDNVAV